MMAEALPLLKIARVAVEDLGGGVYRVKAEVRNTGLIPTATEMQKLVERAIPVKATLTANRELEFLYGESESDVGHFPGAPHEAQEAEWLVRVSGGGTVEFTVTVGAPNAGRDVATATAG
jgi:hypothetical protein